MVELSFGKKYWIERDLQPNLGVSMLGWTFLQRTHSFQAFTAYSCCSVERLERLFNADLTGTTAALLWPYTTTKNNPQKYKSGKLFSTVLKQSHDSIDV